MAKNKYRKYTFTDTYACGHEGEVVQGGYTEEYAQGVAQDKFSGLCPECEAKEREKQRQEETRLAKEEAERLGLPKLKGTKKQKEWAIVLRKKITDQVLEDLSDPHDFTEKALKAQTISNALLQWGYTEDNIHENEEDFAENVAAAWMQFIKEDELTRSSTFWIARNKFIRYSGITTHDMVMSYKDYSKRLRLYSKSNKEILKKAKEADEMTKYMMHDCYIKPMENHQQYPIDVTITADTHIRLSSPKDQGVIDIAKHKGYTWNGDNWVKEITPYIGEVDDCIAEIGNALLSEGYSVYFMVDRYPDIKWMATHGEFTPENPKWILAPKDVEDSLIITWPWYISSDVDYYQEAKKLKGAKWAKGEGMLVPVSNYREILDFADLNNFMVSSQANKRIEVYKESADKAEKVKVEAVQVQPEKLVEIPNDGIVEDLLDD